MIKEIKRNNWSRFVRKFTSDNKYRQISIHAIDKKANNSLSMDDTAFFGLELEKKGRIIDGFRLYTNQYDPYNIPRPVISLKQPEKVTLEKDDRGLDNCLMVKTKEGIEAKISLVGEPAPWRQHELVEKIAYSIYERRGRMDGNDWGDWLAAETLIRQAEEKFA
jgi:hypothetical protein